MTENSSESNPPAIPAVLALAGPLRPLASASHPLHETAGREVAARADWLLAVLGIPGKLAVSLKDGESRKEPGPMLALTVNDRRCWPGGEAVVSLMDRMAKNAGGSQANLRFLLDLLQEACLEMLKDQPEVLLELPQAKAVARELPRPPRQKGVVQPAWPPDPARLLSALRVPVGLGISIADREVAAQVMRANAPLWEAPEDLGELLAGSLSARHIEIRLPQARFRQLTLDWQADGPEAFSQLRFDLAKELGLNLPPFSFQTDADLADDEFVFQVQHIPGLPFSGLTMENILEKLGAEIRRRLPRLVVLPRVEAQLALVDSELNAVVNDRIPLPRLVRELRLRAGQGQLGGLRRLPLILEELLDAPYAAAGAPGSLALL